MASLSSEEKRAAWKKIIYQQQASGKGVSQWCRENQVHPRVFYSWRLKIFPKTFDRSCFIELSDDKKNTGIVIEYQGVRIYLDKHFDSITLKNCLIALRGIKCL